MSTATAARLLGTGSLFFAGWGLLRPASLARVMAVTETEARQIGVREVGIGIALVVQPGPSALVCRALADYSDAVRAWRHDRRVVAGSAAFGSVALALAATSVWSRATPTIDPPKEA